MIIKRGKFRGIYKKREGIEAGVFYEIIILDDFSLAIYSSDDSQNGELKYRKKFGKKFKPLGIWRQQSDGTIYIHSQNDKSFGNYVAEIIGNSCVLSEAEEITEKSLNEFNPVGKEEIQDLLWGVDSYNRFETFLHYRQKLKGKLYWYALRIAYENGDNLFEYANTIKACFKSTEPFRESLMREEELEYLMSLPEKITIYRGMTEIEFINKNFGCSWSLKKEVAEYFAYEYSRNHSTNHFKKVVHKIKINKKDVIAFLNDRQEYEIIYI